MAKKRLVKDYDALPEDIIKSVKLKYPTGYEQHLVTYADKEGKIVSALPFETDEIYYLIRMTIQEAKRLMREADDDLDEESGSNSLRAEVPDMDLDSEYDGQDADDDDLADGTDDENDHIIVTRRRDDDDDDIPDDTDY